MKILLTGATGFVGRHVLRQLIRRDDDIIATTRNLATVPRGEPFSKIQFIPYDLNEDRKDVYQFLGQPDVMIHLAWEGLPCFSERYHLDRNYPAQRRFLTQMLEGGLRSLTVSGTCLEYGLREGCLSEDMPTQPVVAYAQAKDLLQKDLTGLNRQRNFDYKWVRLFYVYGEGQSEKSLLPQLTKALERGDEVFNMSEGKQLRDFVPIEKAAADIVAIALQKRVQGVINCCLGRPVAVKEFVEEFLARQHKRIRLNLGYYPYPDYEPMAFWGDPRKLNEALRHE